VRNPRCLSKASTELLFARQHHATFLRIAKSLDDLRSKLVGAIAVEHGAKDAVIVEEPYIQVKIGHFLVGL
jgi:hypothetical protein